MNINRGAQATRPCYQSLKALRGESLTTEIKFEQESLKPGNIEEE